MSKRRTTFTTETGKFFIDVVCGVRVPYLTVECQHCTYVGDADVPIDLHELNRQASEHTGMCTGEE